MSSQPMHSESSPEESSSLGSKGSHSDPEIFDIEASLNILKPPNQYWRTKQKGKGEKDDSEEEEEEDIDGEEEDIIHDLKSQGSGDESEEDSGKEYKFGLSGSTPPRSAIFRIKKKEKMRKSFSSDSRLPRGQRPHSMTDAYYRQSLSPDQEDDDQASSEFAATSQSRRHTIHDVMLEKSTLSKKDWRKLQRTLSPQQAGGEGTPKSNKKFKKIQRTKDRDDKSGLLHPMSTNTISSELSLPSLVPDVMRATSIGSSGIDEADSNRPVMGYYPNLPSPRGVTESLNPYLYRRGSEADFGVGGSSGIGGGGGGGGGGWIGNNRPRVRRTNSDAQLILSSRNGGAEMRCPPDRKQFYRQLKKSIKYYGISSTSRMEGPGGGGGGGGSGVGGTHMSRFHSENLAASNPFSPLMDKLYLELQAYLKDWNVEKHDEWMFFNRRNIENIISKIMHYSFEMDCAQSLHHIGMSSRDNYETLSGSASSPNMGTLSKRGDTLSRCLFADKAAPSRGGTGIDANSLKRDSLEKGSSPPKNINLNFEVSGCEGDVSTEGGGGGGGGGVDDPRRQGDGDVAGHSDDSDTSNPDLLCYCKVHHRNFLSGLQQRALLDVSKILRQLDEVECLFMNRKRMGDEYSNYRTLYFKRRVRALILWHKVTHSLADNLCHLSNWLGTAIAHPDVCSDPPYSAPPPPEPCPPQLKVSLPSDDALLRADGVAEVTPGGPAHKNNPLLSTQRHPQFSVGVPEEDDLVDDLPSSSFKPKVLTQQSVSSANSTKLDSREEPYREFVNGALKRKGIAFTMSRLKEFISPVLRLSKHALSNPKAEEETDYYEDYSEDEAKPLLLNRAKRFIDPNTLGPFDETHHEVPTALFERSPSIEPQNWMEEFKIMSLPSFSVQYIEIVHVPLDVMHECLRLQVELGNELVSPSPHSVKQLADECREILEHAVDVRVYYRENMEAVIHSSPSKAEQVETDLEGFETDMKNVLKVYFRYLNTWVTLSSGHILEEEWRKVKTICTNIRGGEPEAGRKFCDMVTQLLVNMGDDLDTKMDECCSKINESRSEMDSLHEMDRRELISQSCRRFKELFLGIRERANRLLGFAKILRKDLEIAADFRILTNIPEFFGILKASDHIRVILPHQKLDKMIFVPEGTSENIDEIQKLLNVSFAHGSPEDHFMIESYILLLNVDVMQSQSSWSGKTIDIQASAETTINLSELQVDSLKMVVTNSSHLNNCRESFLSAVGKAVSLASERTSSHENVAERISDLKVEACKLAKRLMTTASKVMEYLSTDDASYTDDHNSSYCTTMHACFNLGFEYVREVFRLVGEDMAYQEIGLQSLDYALVWIHFVLNKCDRGRGARPRWASTGLEFLLVACAPATLASISQTRFENVKKLMNKCVDHVVGEAPPTSSLILSQDGNSILSRIGKHNKKPWIEKKKLLPYGALGFSFTGGPAYLEDEEDHSCAYKLPGSNYREKSIRERTLAPLKLEGPSDYAVYDPSSMAKAAHIKVEPDSGDYDSPYEGGLSTIHSKSPVKSPPTSTESLYSSGVDSPPNQFSSDLTAPAYTPSYPPSQRHGLLATTPSPVDRMDSSGSASSTSRYYSIYQRSPSNGSLLSPLSRSDSNSSLGGMEKIKCIQEKICLLEINREKELRKQKRIGHRIESQTSSIHPVANLRNLKMTDFKWQRGRKLGEGSFGKVYECLNLTTGEINAVKQINIQEKDTGAIQTIIDEISNFQKLWSDYVVKFYGAEIHRNELYMFMEYCNEGTLWTIAQQGLTEEMTRHYTRDIIKAIDIMHTSGIVHRDIKGVNIFLSSNGIKVGDFGLSVQLKNFNKTMPNEIKQQAGTVPYMAPEVILRRDMGRPMDIWSLGCVVIEMATGKLPWSEHDNQFSIMYQLGSGKTPQVPSASLSEEGHRFLAKCFTIDVKLRPTAIELLSDPFVMVGD